VTRLTPIFTPALTIAGSDPSGGAGIQADLKTFHQFGVFGEAAITLLTVQNTVGVRRVDVMPVDLVLAQIDAVIQDIPPAAAKTGALGSAEVIEAIGRAAATWTFPLIVDPVMISKHGARLAAEESVDAFRRYLIPRAAVVMPNLPEAEALCGFPVSTIGDMERAAQILLELGAQSVLIKGGHMTGDPIDFYLDPDRQLTLSATRIDTPNTHGTGCTYSAAVTAGLARGFERLEAIRQAKAFVNEAIRTNPNLGHGSGPLNHWASFAP
jgi:hydroxymethylpyrimidine/phosphomethylpyrimidine kinase